MGKQYRRYTKEFKLQLVDLFLNGDTSGKEIADQYGIHPNMLYKWAREYSKEPEESFPGRGYLKTEDAEKRKQEREMADLRMQVEILKKALAIFSHEKS